MRLHLGTLAIANANGPTATINVKDNGITNAKIGSGTATNGQVLAANGSGSVE